jgi:hypothetical protein
MAQLKRHYAAAHNGAELPCMLKISENPHDYGQTWRIYYEVDAFYSDARTERAAIWLQDEIPEDWDHEAATELGLAPGDDLEREVAAIEAERDRSAQLNGSRA